MKPHEYLYMTRQGRRAPMGCLMIGALLFTAVLVALSLLPRFAGAEALPAASGGGESRREAVLWFRYQDEPYLAQERRAVVYSPERPFETALLSALAAGPDSRSGLLGGVFPAGGRVLSTVRSGRTLFVTVNRRTLENARSMSETERELCLRAIAATVTENCDIDRVQLLVEQGEQSLADTLRMPASFLPGGSAAEPLPPLEREEAALLTPAGVMDRVLALWTARDWPRLWKYVPHGMEGYEDFVLHMESLPAPAALRCEGGSVSGDSATWTLEATVVRDGAEEHITGAVLRLTRSEEIWQVTEEQLTGWLRGE